ncbi:unnamed protein product [Somion occarium]|uniref:GATA-type domain-containing protein n=1 Tax=Somion occarium TaxID=3059160 RepID=A0ABP1E528_9APHY
MSSLLAMNSSTYGTAEPFISGPSSTTAYTTLGQALNTSADPRTNHQVSPDPTLNAHRAPANMASDSRYTYQTSQGPVQAPYPYPYTGASYEAAYTANPPRSVRNDSAHSQSPQQTPPPQPPYNTPPTGYPPHPNYPPPGFAVPSSSQAQWTTEGWQYQYWQAGPQPPATSPYQHNGRPDAPPQPAAPPERRAPSPPPAPKTETRRTERSPRPLEAPPQNSRTRKAKESEIAPAPPSLPPAQPPPGLDFVKLLESYRIIIDSSLAISNDTPQVQLAPNPEVVEKMLEAARYGSQVLDSAVMRAVSEVSRELEDRKESVVEADAAAASNADQATEGQTCLGCNATSTPEWRRGPMGPRTLCNACGLVYAKLIKKRSREPRRSRGGKKGGKATRNESGQVSSGSGSDDDSYDSQERRSEAGDHGEGD